MTPVNQNRAARLRLAFAAALLVLLTAAVYAGSIRAPFVLDDNWNISDNPSIRSLWPPWDAFRGYPDTGVAGRPLVNFSFAVNYALSGLDPAGYHIFNIAVHAACGIALFLLLRLILSGPGGLGPPGPSVDAVSFFSALCFLLHPMQTQAVTYVTQRLESMAALFYLCAFGLAVHGLRADKKAPKALAVLCLFLGAASKETIATAPLAIFCYDSLFASGSPGRALRRSPGLYGGMAAVLCALVLFAAGGATARYAVSHTNELTRLGYALLQPQVLWHYATQFFWPSGLLFDYGWPRDALAGWPGWHPTTIAASTVGLLLALALTLRGLYRRSLAAFALFFYLLVPAPTSSIIPLYCVAAQQRPYLANAALCALVFAGGFVLARRLAARLPQRSGAMALAALWAAVLCLSLGGLTILRNRDFASALALWKDTTGKAAWNSRAQAAYAKALEDAGDTRQAMLRYELAVYMNPHDHVAENNLGHLYARSGKTMRARVFYARALAENPSYAPAQTNMAAALLAEGHPADAFPYAKKGASLKPHDPNSRNTLGATLAALGRTREAIGEFTLAVSGDPAFAEAWANMAFARLNLGELGPARENAEKALGINPNLPLARKTAGIAELALGNTAKAREHLLAAARLAPRDAVVYYNLGVADLTEQNLPRAASFFRRALNLNPSYAKAAQALQAMGAGQ